MRGKSEQLFSYEQLKGQTELKSVNSPDNCGIIDNLKSGNKNGFFRAQCVKYKSLTHLLFLIKTISHHDESQHSQDVVGGISEEGPPCQNHRLWKDVIKS